MKIHEAAIRFKRRIDRGNFACVVQYGPPGRTIDVWPEAATAAVSLVGALDDAKDDDDLDAGLETFKALYCDDEGSIAPINYATWRAEINRVMETMARLAMDVAERARVAARRRRVGQFSAN